ncbi:hypothetical protein MCERE1_03051 [Burkholderiaceae bacterium]
MCKPSPVARALILGLCAGIASCSPALNWREVRHASAPVRVLMPCKPDVAERNIALREQATVLHMQACSAQGKDFSFAAMSLPAGWQASDAIQAWQQASLVSWGARADAVQAQTVTVRAVGGDANPSQWAVDGPSRQVRSLWFAQGGWVYQTAVYAPMQDRSVEAAADTYFSGIAQP